MRQLFCPRRAGIAVTVIALALSAQAPAVAAPSDESPESVALAYPTSPCDPSGPTSADAALAAQLNSQLQAKMRGYMTAYRVSCARMVTKAVRDRGLEVRAAAIAITTTIVETSIQNINIEVDHDSLGLFQQRASWGSRAQRLDPTWATNAFLNKMLSSFPNGSWKTAPIGQVCQTVQVSAYPDRYAVEAGDGVKIANALWSLLDLPAADDGSVQFADLTGDGLDEIISVRPDGRVYAYRNRGWSDPSVYTGSDSRLVAEGFHDPLRTKFADINGDGRDEIISLYADGDVHAYINQG
ncbi:Repeat domain-containing protein, partial [Micromonospora sediminimaris]